MILNDAWSWLMVFDVFQEKFLYYSCIYYFAWQNQPSRVEATNWSAVWRVEEDFRISTMPFRHWSVCQEAHKCKVKSNCCEQHIAECAGKVDI